MSGMEPVRQIDRSEVATSSLLNSVEKKLISALNSNDPAKQDARIYVAAALQGVDAAKEHTTKIANEKTPASALLANWAKSALNGSCFDNLQDAATLLQREDRLHTMGYPCVLTDTVTKEEKDSKELRKLAIKSLTDRDAAVPSAKSLMRDVDSIDHEILNTASWPDTCGGTSGGSVFAFYFRAKAAAILLARHDNPEVTQKLFGKISDWSVPESVRDACAWSLAHMTLNKEQVNWLKERVLKSNLLEVGDNKGPRKEVMAYAFILNKHLIRNEIEKNLH